MITKLTKNPKDMKLLNTRGFKSYIVQTFGQKKLLKSIEETKTKRTFLKSNYKLILFLGITYF
jgi:hypothetical protein